MLFRGDRLEILQSFLAQSIGGRPDDAIEFAIARVGHGIENALGQRVPANLNLR